jgi:hypothetical protein
LNPVRSPLIVFFTLRTHPPHPPVGLILLLSAGKGPFFAKTTVRFSCEMYPFM